MPPIPVVSFFVPGRPRTAGSKRAIPLKRRDGSWVKKENGAPVIVVVDTSGEEGEAWRSQVRDAAIKAYGDFRKPLEGPLSVAFTFHMVRPRAHFGTGRNAERLRETAPSYPVNPPDLLKMARAVEDSLTSVVWRDDSQIVTELLSKCYAETFGVRVDVYRDPKAAASLPAAAQLKLL